MDTHPNGSIYWIDLGTSHPQLTANFYGQLFGWAISAPDSSGYMLCSLENKLVAGLGISHSNEQPYWTVNFREEDLTDRVAKFERSGGSIMLDPTPSGPLGNFAMAADPQGASVGFWQPLQPSGMETRGQAGTFAGAMLISANPRVATNFYATAMDWQSNSQENHLRLPDGSFAPVITQEKLPSNRPQWVTIFACTDKEDTSSRLCHLGGQIITDVNDRIRLAQDCSGALLGLRTIDTIAVTQEQASPDSQPANSPIA